MVEDDNPAAGQPAADAVASVADAIEAAEERAENAEAAAEALADAIVETEQDRRISTLETGVSECLNSIKTMQEEFPQMLQAGMQTLAQEMGSANAAALQTLSLQLDALRQEMTGQKPLIPPQSEQVETPPAMTPPEAAKPAAPAEGPAEAKPETRKRHRFL